MATRVPESSNVRGQDSACAGWACAGFGFGCTTTTCGRGGTTACDGGSGLEHDAHEHSAAAATADSTNRNCRLITHLPVWRSPRVGLGLLASKGLRGAEPLDRLLEVLERAHVKAPVRGTQREKLGLLDRVVA